MTVNKLAMLAGRRMHAYRASIWYKQFARLISARWQHISEQLSIFIFSVSERD